MSNKGVVAGMRVGAMLAVALAGCSGLAACSEQRGEDAERAAALSNYVPPFVMSRLDFGGVVERRFRRLDVNGDDHLSPQELPKRLAPRFAEIDRNDDGRISNEEWSEWMLARFDAQDANHDGILTSDERQSAREHREMDLPTPAEEPAANKAG